MPTVNTDKRTVRMYRGHLFEAECSRLPNWLPEPVQQYLAHTGAGVSIRDLARLARCHASTISRRVARVEQRRDDPLVDAALRQMETRIAGADPEFYRRLKEELSNMNELSRHHSNEPLPANFEREALRVLRRLCETRAVLAIAADMDMAVVVREGEDGSTTRTAVVAQDITQAMALKGWIETRSTGRILRYVVTTSGRDAVREMIERNSAPSTSTALVPGMAEAPVPFGGLTDYATPVEVRANGGNSRARYNLAESPLTALARRKDKSGTPFLDEDLVRCGERLREDFELAQMEFSDRDDWNDLVEEHSMAVNTAKPARINGPEAARARVVAALRDLGPGLSDVALRCCCYLEGLETTEQKMGWSARSGKIVLRIALQRLKRHYDETLTPESQLIG